MNQIVTPEAFCWRYAAGCLEQRNQQNPITPVYLKHLKKCIAEGRTPYARVIREVFRTPFERIGDNVTLEAMQHYWRVEHQSLRENTPVYRACVQRHEPEPTWPYGSWWRVWAIDQTLRLPVQGILVHNIHKLSVREKWVVYIHGAIIAEVTDEYPEL